MDILSIVLIVIAAAAGAAVTWLIVGNQQKGKAAQVIKEAESKAEVIRKDKELQAKERFMQLKSEHEKEVNTRNSQMQQAENRIKQKEQTLNQKVEATQRKENELEKLKEQYTKQLEAVNHKKEELDKNHSITNQNFGKSSRYECRGSQSSDD
jgi:ribonuclease Y